MVRNLVLNLENLKLYKLHHIEHGTEHIYGGYGHAYCIFSLAVYTTEPNSSNFWWHTVQCDPSHF